MHHIGEPCKAAASWPLLFSQVSNQNPKMLPLRAGHTVHPCHLVFPDSNESVGFGFDDRTGPDILRKCFDQRSDGWKRRHSTEYSVLVPTTTYFIYERELSGNYHQFEHPVSQIITIHTVNTI